MEFVEVPAGPFLMGEDDTDLADIKPQHELDLPTYYIGRTETTNAQFRPFVEGDGYTNQEYWTEAGWKWREEEGMTEPRWWNTSPWNDSTKPVAGISWYEAVAYANWLSDQTGHEYRLPTEAEWEKAARGSDGRIYPWGDQEPNDSLANYDGIDGGGTQPVGSYPDGASPYGALDMIGNLEEWCSTKAGKEYPYQVEDEWTASYLAGDSRRVQRGGGFITELDTFLQAANRENQVPSLNTYFTFRLASSSQP
jgi:formylglycine-generating enzyme required for sulfatase activity